MMEIHEKFIEIIARSVAPVVLEFGACEGEDTMRMTEHLISTGKPFIYHAFEPNDSLNDDFYNRNRRYVYEKLIQHFNIAIGDLDGEIDFHISSGKKMHHGHVVDSYHGSSSIKKPVNVLRDYPEMSFVTKRVPIVKLDTHYANSELSARMIDFIWADVQAAEKDMIRGGIKTFTNRVRYLYTEYCDGNLYDDKTNINDILKLLPNYEVVKDFGGDVLLVNRKLVKL